MDRHTKYIASLDYDLDQLLAVDLEPHTAVEPAGRERHPNRVIITTRRQIDLNTHVEEQALLDPNPSVVYPGALVQQDRDLVEGHPVPITLARAPLTIKVALPGLGERGSATIERPTAVTVNNAIDDIVARWFDDACASGYRPPLQAFSMSHQSFTKDQIGVQLGFGVQWANNSATAAMNVESTDDETIVFRAFKQVFYSVYIEEPEDAGDVFDEDAHIEDQITEAHPPGYVRKVDYGRIIVCQMRTHHAVTKQDAEATLDYVTAGDTHLDAKVREQYDKIKSESDFRAVALGGAGGAASDLLATGDPNLMQQAITEGIEFSKQNLGVPVAYVVADLKTRQLSMVKTRGDYTYAERKVLPDRTIKVVNDGWYDAKFTVTWFEKNEHGDMVQQSWSSGRANMGYDHSLDVPADAEDFTVEMSNWTGWIGEPHKHIARKYGALQGNLEFRTAGTTMSPSLKEHWS